MDTLYAPCLLVFFIYLVLSFLPSTLWHKSLTDSQEPYWCLSKSCSEDSFFLWKTWRIFPKRQNMPRVGKTRASRKANFGCWRWSKIRFTKSRCILKQKHLTWGRCLMDGDGGSLNLIWLAHQFPFDLLDGVEVEKQTGPISTPIQHFGLSPEYTKFLIFLLMFSMFCVLSSSFCGIIPSKALAISRLSISQVQVNFIQF